ncbi:MAG: aromatic ring-hydroxylating dioxygenase subunit alpha [Gloeomargarita sp. SKYG116]|nr:aromatic ring-hydroxylating dioxygenase subunit alpha [Gloeomargarita sp. SKYG116]MDW8400641.1 aromatic ring-hydroxylating dioxygenase subunit alpha [Gloeomargarita sp. SKYGB_i_bin116]
MKLDQFLLQAQHYTDPTLIPQEQAQIFHQTWLYLGPAEPVAMPGTVWATHIAGVSVLVIRDEAGQLRGFHNLCPHRAMELCPEPGIFQTKRLICPYHAWVYDLQGQFVAAARQKGFGEGFDGRDYPLQPVRVAVWQGLLFVSFNPDVMPLAEYLAPMSQMLGLYPQGEWRWRHQQTRRVACNWKVYHDNTLCDYHVAVAHSQTLHRLQGPVRHYQHRFGRYVNALVTPVPPEWLACHRVLRDLPPENQTHFYTFGVFPNLHILALPDGSLACLRIDPVTVDECDVVTDIYGMPETNLDELLAELEAFMREDMALAESVQRGYASGRYQPGPVHPLEARILHHQKLLLAHLQGAMTTLAGM